MRCTCGASIGRNGQLAICDTISFSRSNAIREVSARTYYNDSGYSFVCVALVSEFRRALRSRSNERDTAVPGSCTEARRRRHKEREQRTARPVTHSTEAVRVGFTGGFTQEGQRWHTGSEPLGQPLSRRTSGAPPHRNNKNTAGHATHTANSPPHGHRAGDRQESARRKLRAAASQVHGGSTGRHSSAGYDQATTTRARAQPGSHGAMSATGKRIGAAPVSSGVKGGVPSLATARAALKGVPATTVGRDAAKQKRAQEEHEQGRDEEDEAMAEEEGSDAELRSGEADSQPSAAEQISALQEELQRQNEKHAQEARRHAQEVQEMKEMMRGMMAEATRRTQVTASGEGADRQTSREVRAPAGDTTAAPGGPTDRPQRSTETPQQPTAQPLPTAGNVVYEQVRRAAIQPDTLRYATASDAGVLEGWLFQLEKMFRQLSVPEAEFARRAQEAALAWDLDVDRWWRMHEAQAAARGAPIATWAAFVAALNSQFVPVAEREAAVAEFFRLQQHGNESMDAYLLRAARLLVRARGAIEDATAARFVVERADEARFPFALAKVRDCMREQGGATAFATIRASLVAAAMHEPKPRSGGSCAAAASSSSGGTRTAGRGGAQAKPALAKQLRVAALRKQLEELEADEDAEVANGPIQAASLNRGPNARAATCHKCRAVGHVAAECRSKRDMRSCFVCGRTGHIARSCPLRKGSGDATDGDERPEGTPPRPKNA